MQADEALIKRDARTELEIQEEKTKLNKDGEAKTTQRNEELKVKPELIEYDIETHKIKGEIWPEIEIVKKIKYEEQEQIIHSFQPVEEEEIWITETFSPSKTESSLEEKIGKYIIDESEKSESCGGISSPHKEECKEAEDIDRKISKTNLEKQFESREEIYEQKPYPSSTSKIEIVEVSMEIVTKEKKEMKMIFTQNEDKRESQNTLTMSTETKEEKDEMDEIYFDENWSRRMQGPQAEISKNLRETNDDDEGLVDFGVEWSFPAKEEKPEEYEEDIWGDRTSPLRNNKRQLEEVEDEKEQEFVVDIWEGRTSPPPRTKIKLDEVSGEKVIEVEEDIWGEETSSPRTKREKENVTEEKPQVYEQDIWGRRTSPLPQTKTQIEGDDDEKEQEFKEDIWEGRTSPTSKNKQKLDEASEEKALEFEEDIWGRRTSPLPQQKRQIDRDADEKEQELEEDIWEGRISPPLRNKIKLDEVSEEKALEFEKDIWGVRTSPARKKSQKDEVSEEKPQEFEEDIWGGRPSPLPQPKRQIDDDADEKEPEFEEDIWGGRPSPLPQSKRQIEDDADEKEPEFEEYIWEGRISPSPRTTLKLDGVSEEKALEFEEDIWGRRTSLLQQPKRQIEDDVDKKEQEFEEDIWEGRTSPSLKSKLKLDEVSEEKALEFEEDIWGGRTSPLPRTKSEKEIVSEEKPQEFEEDIWEGRTSPLPQSKRQIEGDANEKEQELKEDIWEGRTSPPLRSKLKLDEVSEEKALEFEEDIWGRQTSLPPRTKSEKEEVSREKSQEFEEDIWGGRTSPLPQPKRQVEDDADDREPEFDKDIWEGRTSPHLGTKLNLDEVSGEKAREVEEDIWGGRKSPLPQPKRQIEIDVDKKEQEFEEDIWKAQSSPPPRSKLKLDEVSEEKALKFEEDIWGGRTSPLPRTKSEKEIVSQEKPQEFEEDIWGGRTSPLPQPKRQIEDDADEKEPGFEKDVWEGRTSPPTGTKLNLDEVSEEKARREVTEDIWGGKKSPLQQTKSQIENDVDEKEQEFEEDIWEGRSSPPLRSKLKLDEFSEEKALEFEEDIWGGRTSPLPRTKGEKDISEEKPQEFEEDIWEGRTSPPLRIKCEKEEISEKKPHEPEEDIWGGRRSPLPQNKRQIEGDADEKEQELEEDIWEGRISPLLRTKLKLDEVSEEKALEFEEDIWGGRTSPLPRTKSEKEIVSQEKPQEFEEDIWGGRTSPLTQPKRQIEDDADEKEPEFEKDVWEGRTSPPPGTKLNLDEVSEEKARREVTEDIWGGKKSPLQQTKSQIENDVDEKEQEFEEDIWEGRSSPPLRSKLKLDEFSEEKALEFEEDIRGGRTSPLPRTKSEKEVSEEKPQEFEEDIWGGRTSPLPRTKSEKEIVSQEKPQEFEEDIWGGRTSPLPQNKRQIEGDADEKEQELEEDIWEVRISPPLRTKLKLDEVSEERALEFEEDIWGGRTSPLPRTKSEKEIVSQEKPQEFEEDICGGRTSPLTQPKRKIEDNADEKEPEFEKDIWEGRTSPAPGTKLKLDEVSEEKARGEVEEDIWGGQKSPLQQPKRQIEDYVDEKEQEFEEDLWEGRSSPPLRSKLKLDEFSEEKALEEKPPEFEQDIWGGRTSPLPRAKSEKEEVSQEKLQEFVEDIWGGRTSPPLRKKCETEEVSGQKQQELEVDIWEGRSSPLSQNKRQVGGDADKKELELEEDIWEGRTSPPLKTKLKPDEVSEKRALEFEEGILRGRTSPPPTTKSEKEEVSEEKPQELEEDIWGELASPVLRHKPQIEKIPQQKASEVEENVWEGLTSSISTYIPQSLQIEESTKVEFVPDIKAICGERSSLSSISTVELINEEIHAEAQKQLYSKTKEISKDDIALQCKQEKDIDTSRMSEEVGTWAATTAPLTKYEIDNVEKGYVTDTFESTSEKHIPMDKINVDQIQQDQLPSKILKVYAERKALLERDESNICKDELVIIESNENETLSERSLSPGRSKLKDILEEEKELVYKTLVHANEKDSTNVSLAIAYDEKIEINLNRPELRPENDKSKDIDMWTECISPPIGLKMETIEEVSQEKSTTDVTNTCDEPLMDSWTLETRSPSVYSQVSFESNETLRANDIHLKMEENGKEIHSKVPASTECLQKEDESKIDIEEEPLKSVFDKPSKETPEDFTSVRLDKSGEVILEREKTKITEKTKVEAVKVEVKGTEQKTEHVPETFELPAAVDDKIKEQETKPEVKEKQETGSDKRDIGKKTLRRRSKPEDTATPKIQSVAPAETSLEESPAFKTLEKKDNTSETLRKKQDKLTQEEEFCKPLKTAECPEILPATTMDPSSALVGLVQEDRPEYQGRHAHTSIAAAWRAPGGGQKPVFRKPLIGDVVEPGDGTSFICEIQHPAQYYVTWLKDNKVLDDKLADRVIQQDENCRHALKILHCQLEDSGIYTAKATDNRGAFATCSAQLLVQELSEEEKATRIAEKKPFFLVKMRPTEVIENTNLSYAVHVKGDPMPAVTFYKDNERLQEDDRVKIRGTVEQGKYELVISHVQMKDAGIYRCIAMNKFEQAECEAKMGVLEEEITLQSLHGKGSLLQPGESADFKWFRDGVEFNPIDRFNVMFKDEEDTLALVFQNVTPDDAGIYTCVASTSCGKISCSAELTVEGSVKRLTKDPEPPGFLEELSDTFVTVGGTAMLECRISGYPKPDLTWCCNGIDLRIGGRIKQMWEDDESVTLIIKNISEGDKGLYTVKATNELGSVESSGRLVMRTGPKFRKFEKAITCNIDVPLKFIVEVDGEPLPELKWLKDGKEIQPNDHIHFESQPDGVFMMHIDRMTPKDCGSYSMVATNDMGQRAETFEIQTDTPPEITRGLDPETEKKASNDHTFEVRANGSPSPTATWYKNGKEISTDDKYRITKDGNIFMLKLRNLKRSDMGQYKIVLENRNGKDESEGALIIRGPPEFTTPMKNAFAKEGAKDTKLFVEWDANPRPTVKWFFKDKVIHEDTPGYTIKSTDTTSLLIIHDAIEEFTGPYSLKASNEYGDRSTSAKFRLHEKPQVIEPLQDVEFLEKTKCKFQCKVSGCPLPEVKWTKNGSKWTPNETEVFSKKEGEDIYYLYFETISTDDTAKYVGTFTNVEGSVTSEGSIIVNTSCGLNNDPTENVSTIVKTKRLIEVEKCELLEDFKGKENFYLNDQNLPSILPSDFIEVDDNSETVSYESRATETQFRRVKQEDLEETPPTITGCNFQEGKKLIAMHKFVLEVEATAVPEAEATWYLNDRELKEDEDKIKCSYDGKVYKLERLGSDPDHTGEYKCKLKNKIKEVEVSGLVTIIEKEARVRQPLKDTSVKENQDATIQCQIVGDPIPTVEWFRNGKPVMPSGKIEIREDREKRMHYLTFKDLQEEDKSTFTLVGKNEHGTCETLCVVGIYVAPRPGELQDVTVDYGRDLWLSLFIHAIPPPKMTWFKNGEKLSESERILYHRDEENEMYSFEIKSTVVEDGATYTFKAENEGGEGSGQAIVKIHTEAPTIVSHPEDMESCLEDEVTFITTCAGLPVPVVEWRNKDSVLKEDDRHTLSKTDEYTHTLTIRDITMKDYGTLKVTAINLVSEASSYAELTQKKLPCEILQDLENVTRGGEGEAVSLNVVIRGSPRPKFVWTKDGDEVEATANIKLGFKKLNYCEATISLTLVEASSADSGQYRLRFYNELNEAQTETALVVRPVRRKPKISGKPKDLQVIEMEPGMFKCKIAGYPKPEVTWLKDGRIVRPTDILNTGMTADGEYFLEFKKVTLEDAGKYTVVAKNDEGKVEHDMNLVVNPTPSKPKFISGLKATKVICGYPCRMEVTLDGFPRPKVAWLKNGKPVEIDGSHIKEMVTDDGKVILQIASATDDDAGEYTAVASNDLGENASSATLSVLDHERKDGQPDGLPSFSEGLKDSTFDEGKTIKLPVSVKGGPVPDMKWYKDGKEIKLGKRVFFTYDGDKTYLEIHPCEGADSGMYKCVIENPSGKKETECEVRVRKCFEPPSFTYLYPNQQQLPGLDVKFTIKVDGVPKPELSWFFNGKKITPDGEKYRIRKDADGCTLFVKETTYSDSGAYKVVAKNKEGEVEHEASLVVADDIDPNRKAEAPTILKAIGDQELYEGYTAKFKAVVAGRPQPEFEWFRNGVKLFPNNRYIAEMDLDGLIRLTIKYVCQEDTGLYELRVWNEHGQASCKGKLICECISKEKRRPVGDEYMGFDKIRTTGAPIPIPDRPIISALSDRRCTLSWVPFLPPGPMLPVTYQVEMCECPEGDWFTPVSGIRGNSVELKDLCPKSDYKFRVRVENKYGVSEPSPYVTTYRNQLERNPLSHEPFLEPTIDTIYDGPYVPAGFKIDRAPSGSFYAPPRFLRLDHDTQYGMKNFSGHVKWIGYGYPTPKLRFYFKDHELHFDKGSRYKYTQEADGEIFLFIDNITEDDVGWYKCEAYNEYGLTHQRIRLGLSEYPRVLQHLQEVHIKSEHSGRILCRIAAYPPCDVTWFKDWREIRPSMKHRPQFIEPDMYVLNLNGVNIMDTGLYSMAAVNVSGAVSSSCMVNVIEDDAMYNWFGYGRGKEVMINMRHGTLEDHYDIGDELGRGTQGVTFYCTERFSGRNFAAKSMWGTGQFKDWMHNEFEMLNFVSCCNRIVRLYDAYEGPKNLVLVEELCAGGELLHVLTQRQYYTEYEIALYIRQILEGLDYMHDRWIAHLGLNIGDIMVTRVNGHDIKIGDLSLARNIRLGKLRPMEYGMPEFVAPEIVKGEGATYAADMWAVGVITYLLLSGTSPFRGEHDRETLTRIQNGELRFDVDAFAHLSDESKDFIAKLLQYQPQHRLDVKSALVHPWIKFSEMSPLKPYTISTDRLKTYYYKYKDWYLNASCKRWYRRRTLASAFTHPSRMVYPPGEEYTPPDTPEREIVPVEREDFSIPEYDLSYEIEEFRSDSRYQHGPDTYLLQVRDPDFPARIRSYMNLTRCRSPVEMFVGRDLGYDYERTPVIHERRRFTDIMDEEIKDERRRRTMIDKYTAGFIRSKDATCSLDLPGRVKKEVSSRYIRKEEVTKKEYKDKSRAPFLREKPSTVSVTPGMDVVLSCVVTGNPEPVVQWYRNDIILGETSRISIGNVEGRSQLSIKNSNDYDLGFYKIMARNDFGTVAHKFRIVRAQIPGMCDPPEVQEVSGSQILLKWSSPIDDGDAPIEYYHLQKKSPDTAEWSTVSDYIAQEVFLVESLSPNNLYQFRVAARNIRGSGDFSIATCGIRTGSKDDPRLKMPVEQQLQKDAKLLVLQLPGARGEIRDLLDYSREIQHVPLKSGDAGPLQMSKYQMVKEIARGRFSRVMRCIRKDDQRTFACKILLNHDRAKVVKQEYEAAKSLRHERLTTMYETCELPDVTVFIMEYFGGPDVLTFLADKLQYTEQHVSIVINQVLDALSYLHWRGLCHLNIQPDNVVVISPHKLDIKVGDFGATQKVNETGSKVEIHGLMDYTAPEVLFDQTAYPSSDIWSVGVLTYILLTGESPFLGEREQETMENIQCVRSKFEILGELTSQEATRFILLIFKRDPIKRPNEEECREHRWLGENDFMVKKRERHPLSTNRLREYSAAYHTRRQKESSASNIFSSFMDQC